MDQMDLGSNQLLDLFCGENFTFVDSEVPGLSDCFESLTFVYGPFALLAASSAFYIGRLRIPDIHLKTPRAYLIRMLCTAITLVLTLANAFITIFPHQNGSGHYTIRFAVVAIALMAHFIYLQRLKKVHFLRGKGPMWVVVSWILTLPHFVANAEFLVAKAVHSSQVYYIIEAVFATVSCISQIIYLICLTLPNNRFRAISIQDDSTNDDQDNLLRPDSSSFDNLPEQSQQDANKPTSVTDTANGFSKLFFCWVQPLMQKGAKGGLSDKDAVYTLPKDLNTLKLHSKFFKVLIGLQFNNERRPSERNVLLTAMHLTFGRVYYLSGILKLLADSLSFAGPLLLNRLVNYIENPKEPFQHGYYYAAGLFGSTFLAALLSTHFDYQVNKVKLRVKSALITNIYHKTLYACPTDLSFYSSGEITNFMSTDVDRVVNFFASFHEFWSLPFQVAVTLYLLYQQVGIVFLAGLGLAIVMIIFNRFLATKIGQYNAAMMKEKDSRVKLMTEVLLGIRVIKFNAWEYFMADRLNSIRVEELRNLKGIKYFDAGCVYLWATTPVLISLLTFSVYSALGNELTAANVFTVIALINMLIAPLNAFPWVVNGLMEAWISVKRLNQFIQVKNIKLEDFYGFSEQEDLVLKFENASFSWNPALNAQREQKDQGLDGLSLQVKDGQFIGVIGTVGSGKSSLLSAIIAEMRKVEGKIYVDCVQDGFAIVTQEPWIQHATIRDNILWGMQYDVHRYESVIDACALQEDLNMFPDQDLTEVGENGVTLSGGQKARVALARALYQDKSLYLLDDPLAAVDQHVASHLHDRCLIRLMADKTRILCTHHTKYLRHADAIVVMQNGAIKEIGTPEDILQLTPDPSLKKISAGKRKTEVCNASKRDLSPSEDSNEKPIKLMSEEEKMVGTVALKVYKSYWMAVGTCLALNILLFLFLMQGSKVTSDWWLSHWVTEIQNNNTGVSLFGNEYLNNENMSDVIHLHFTQPLVLSPVMYTSLLKETNKNVSAFNENVRWYLMIYGCIAASNSVFTLLRSFLFAYGGIKAAEVIHSLLLDGVLQAPISFFDITPVGRILNRFSSDTYTVDDSLPFILNIFLAQFVGVLGTIVITCYGLPWFSVALLPLGIFYFYIQYYYRLTSRELKRLSSISLSPIYAHFTESLNGLATIRSFRKHSMFRLKNWELVDGNQRCNFSTLAAQEWFAIRLQMIGVLMVTTVAFVAVIMHQKHYVSPGLAGLALSYALSVTSRLSGVITAFTETEKQMVAVERESYYINNIPKERVNYDIDPRIIGHWPYNGGVEFNQVSMKYRKDLPLALNNVSFKIRDGEKVGIVGRTGSGKSSLFALLFGIVDPCDGEVFLDGVDIKNVPLQTLRSKLSIIPQDPFLFSGSLKENLLPCAKVDEVYNTNELMRVLERCNLKEKVMEMGGIHASVGERGKRLSVGQRQLLCLARALLTDSKIVCLDEATANVDGESDAILQKTIREQFRKRTVLTIAHRIETVMDCDRVIVMNDGRVAEVGKPGVLMDNEQSQFFMLARAIGQLN